MHCAQELSIELLRGYDQLEQHHPGLENGLPVASCQSLLLLAGSKMGKLNSLFQKGKHGNIRKFFCFDSLFVIMNNTASMSKTKQIWREKRAVFLHFCGASVHFFAPGKKFS